MRAPAPPERDQLEPFELEAFDRMSERHARGPRRGWGGRHPKTAGGFGGLMASPPLAAALLGMGDAVMQYEALEGRYSGAHHQLIDLVLSFDAGHWGLLAGHTPMAVVEGIGLDTIEALRDGREDLLDDDLRFQVDFIRATRGGELTDELWARMAEEIGSERGVVEHVFMILLLNTHVRLMQAFDEIQITPGEYEDLLGRIRDGSWEMPDTAAMKEARFSAETAR